MRSAWSRAARGWFLELRLIPVLLWSYTAIALGTGVAAWESGLLTRAGSPSRWPSDS